MTRLEEWGRGFVIVPEADESRRMYFWFYEWNLFEAVKAGQHTPGCGKPVHDLANDSRSGTLTHDDLGLRISVTAVEDGAELLLEATNRTEHDWPDIAAVIPCFNPGKLEEVPETESFFDDAHERTWYVGQAGPDSLVRRDIHFNHRFRASVDAEAENGTYVFTEKWPTSPDDAYAGLLMRESADREWIAGIAWERFVSAQGHNPWRCMHLSIRLGPLAPGATRQVRGRIFLFPGTRDDCLSRFHECFPAT